MIKLRDLPGVDLLDARRLLNARTNIKIDHEAGQMAADIMVTVFGVGRADIEEWDWSTELTGDDECEIAEWAKMGWDVTAADGRLLECVPDLEQAMLLVTDGCAGKSKLEIEASAWAASVANDPKSPKDAARDRGFLALGQPARRRRFGWRRHNSGATDSDALA